MIVKKISAISRGKDRGATLFPHRYKEGHFLVTKGRQTSDHNRKVFDEGELVGMVNQGYGIRMSGPGHAPSTFMPQSLIISE
jgi:hypothetical protein